MIKTPLTVLSLLFCFSSIAGAITISPLGPDIPKNGTGIGGGNSNNAENNFFRLQTYLAANPQFADCVAVFEGAFRGEDSTDVDVTGFDFAVVHYGKGRGGSGGGGGVAFFDVSGFGVVDFPSSGSGPNGFGGFSSLDLFKCEPGNNVPDGGTTAMLLGSALTGLGLMRRCIKAK